MTTPLSWPRRLWLAMGLRGRLVAGYSTLFALLLVAIAIGETTVVRQVLIEDRKAALPAAMSDLSASVRGVMGPKQLAGGGVAQGGATLRIVSGDAALIVAFFGPDGTMLYHQDGAGTGNLDPKQLFDRRQAAGASATNGGSNLPAMYQRTVGATTYLIALRAMPLLPFSVLQPPGSSDGGQPPGSGGIVTTAPGFPGQRLSAATIGTVLVAESLRPVEDTVHALLLITLAASALGLLLAAMAGLAVARRALSPLERMTATAQSIAAGGDGALDQRLRLPGWGGDEVGRLATTFDHMLDRIQATIAERVRSETRLRHFAADASHELRTPLAAVSGYTEVLLMGGKDDPETATHVLRQMERELTRMNRLVGDLLTLARLDAGLPVQRQALPVAPLIEGLAEETRLLAAQGGRDLIVAAQPDEAADLVALADPDRLHQILLNLLHNAVKFTPDGGRITVCAARRNGAVALSVADTGPGIAADELPLLFERFYRGDKARVRGDGAAAGGTGLGLAIAQALARAQGGHIEVASTPGAGSTFTVILPATPPEA